MSSETIVNRTPLGVGLERDLAELAKDEPVIDAVAEHVAGSLSVEELAKAVFHAAPSSISHPIPAEFKYKSVLDTPEGEAVIDEIVEKAAVELGMAAGVIGSLPSEVQELVDQTELEQLKTEPKAKFIPGVIEPPAPDDTVIREAIAKLRSTRDPDLKIFKQQVIAAFKHMGVDTNKFFGV